MHYMTNQRKVCTLYFVCASHLWLRVCNSRPPNHSGSGETGAGTGRYKAGAAESVTEQTSHLNRRKCADSNLP